MRATLKGRLNRLEVAAAAAVPQFAMTEAQQAELHRILVEKAAKVKAEEKERTHPDPHIRLAYWHRALAGYESIIANGGQAERPSPPSVLRSDGLEVIRRKMAEAGVPAARWHVLEAQLAILAQAGYSTPEIETLHQEHRRYEGIPWQWQGPEIPVEALNALRKGGPD